MEVGALSAAGWAWSVRGRHMLRWEVGVAGWAWSLHGKQTRVAGWAQRVGAPRLWGVLVLMKILMLKKNLTVHSLQKHQTKMLDVFSTQTNISKKHQELTGFDSRGTKISRNTFSQLNRFFG